MNRHAAAQGRSVRGRAGAWTLACLLSLAPGAPAPAGEDLDLDITGTSIRDLMELRITSASKTGQNLNRSAAAVYVLTGEEIRRAGVTTIPDALRLVPGVQVARVDGSKWAVTIRGFGSRTANKLLVMIDGRSVYNPLFTGTLWEVKSVPIHEIERIEVVRGPGGTLWGANAVNGVINIITRTARDTDGALISAGGGGELRAGATARYGWRAGPKLFARVWADHAERREGFSTTGIEDGSRIGRAGFRLDWGDEAGEPRITLQGGVYEGEVDEGIAAGGSQSVDHDGGNILLRWSRPLGDGSTLSIQTWYDRAHLDNLVLEETRDTVDLEVQHTLAPRGRHAAIWGANARYTADELRDSPALSVEPDRRTDWLFSVFAQDRIEFTEPRIHLIAGAKLEHNDYTGFELQPNLRVSWMPSGQRTLWAAVSRAVRIPSRLESDLVAPISGPPEPVSETLVAYEAGFRAMPAERLSLDWALFYNVYDDLLTVEGLTLGNRMRGSTWGVEWAGRLRAGERCRLDLTYGYLRLDLETEPGSQDVTSVPMNETRDPRHQATATFAIDLPRRARLDATARYVDRLSSLGVPAYVVLDLTLGWRPREGLELELAARDLLEGHHPEQAGATTTEVRKSVHGSVTVEF